MAFSSSQRGHGNTNRVAREVLALRHATRVVSARDEPCRHFGTLKQGLQSEIAWQYTSFKSELTVPRKEIRLLHRCSGFGAQHLETRDRNLRGNRATNTSFEPRRLMLPGTLNSAAALL